MLPKIKRVVNRKLLDKSKLKPCAVCRKTPTDPDHIITRGAFGPDENFNILPLCREHHTERHAIGYFKMCEKYPFLKQELYGRGFVFDGNKKLRRE